jgi:exopolysaccharide production protein ExoQ
MITTTLSSSWTDNRASSLPSARAASDKIAIGFLTLSLLLSFLQYCFERSDLVRLVPVVLLWAGAFLCLVICPREKRRAILTAVVQPATLATIALVTAPPILSSLFYRAAVYPYPYEYGVVIIVTLVGARILLSEIGFQGVLLSFFYATTAGILIVVCLTFSDLLASIGSTRYAPLYFDPNRIGFFAVTSIPAQLWFAVRYRRYYVLLVSALCVFVVLAASSRGSIGALLIGGLATSLLYAVRLARSSPFTISRNKLIGMLALLCVFMVIAGVEQRGVASAGQYLQTKLALHDRDRGLNTGFTGRTTGWSQLVEILPKTPWLIGNGYRTSDEDFSFSVDNGYLAGLYELGLFSIILVLAKYIFIVYFLSAVYVRNRSAMGTSIPALFFTLVIFLANAFVHRVFFGIGDQASILALFAFTSTRQDVLNELQLPAAIRF